jgi:hypothetical protein
MKNEIALFRAIPAVTVIDEGEKKSALKARIAPDFNKSVCDCKSTNIFN